MKINIPKKIFGKDVDGAIDRTFSHNAVVNEPKVNIPSVPNVQPLTDGLDSYVIFPSGKYGNHTYPELLIGKNRLSYNPEVQKIAEKLGLNLQNNSEGYIGNINYPQAISLNESLGNFTLPLILGKEFIKLLRDGANGKKVYAGNGRQISSSQLDSLYKEITEVRNPWRSEWYDTKFSTEKNQGILNKLLKMKWLVEYPVFENGTIKKISEPLEECLREDKKPGIDLDNWLDSSTNQGLPKFNSSYGDLYYWHPRNGSVAVFYANSDWAFLDCGWDPSLSNSALGVRAARVRT